MSNAKRTMFMADVTDATQEGRTRTAQEVNIIAAKEIANLVRSTLGPMGMDKMMVKNDGNVTVTNDGATILREVNITHPTARMIIQVAKTQEAECYDGTTSAVILAGELMKQTEQLLGKGIHPTMIVRGFKAAAKRAAGRMLPTPSHSDPEGGDDDRTESDADVEGLSQVVGVSHEAAMHDDSGDEPDEWGGGDGSIALDAPR